MRVLLIILTLIAALLAAAVLGLIIGALLPPTHSLVAVIGSMLWAPFGPFLATGSILACLCGLLAHRTGFKRLGQITLLLAVPAIIGSGAILTRITLAATAAGGTVRLPTSFLIGPMDQPAPDRIERIRSVNGFDQHAALYLPPATTQPAPIITYIHGGGFMTGTKTETAADLRWFADQGWLVISVDYRLFEPETPTWDKAPDDVACALIWVMQNAGRFGGDIARIALLGDSAGGNLAINLGFNAAAGRATSSCSADIPVPSAIATLYPAVDPISIYDQGFPIPGFEPRMLIEGYIGGTPEDFPDRVAAVASASFLTAQAPPTLIILPEKDSLVIASGTRAFARAAGAAGVPLELVQIPFANHVFNQMAANSLGNQIGRSIRLRFLNDHMR